MKHKKICALAWSECWHKEPGYLLRACRVHSMNPRSTWHLCEFACSRKWNHYKKAALNGDYTKSILDWSLVLQECVLSKNCDGAKNAIEPRAEEEEGMSHEALLQSRKLRCQVLPRALPSQVHSSRFLWQHHQLSVQFEALVWACSSYHRFPIDCMAN